MIEANDFYELITSKEQELPQMIKNIFEVTTILNPTVEDCPQITNVAYIYGLWI